MCMCMVICIAIVICIADEEVPLVHQGQPDAGQEAQLQVAPEGDVPPAKGYVCVYIYIYIHIFIYR